MRPILCLLLSTVLTFAQQSKPAAREVTLRLLSFYSDGANPELHAHDLKNPQKPPGIKTPLKNYLNHETSSLHLMGNEIVFTTGPQPPTKLEEQAGHVTLPEKGNVFLLMFFPAEKTGTYNIMALDDSTQAFPLGSFRVFNLSHSNIRVTLEKTEYNFKPSQVLIIDKPPVQANNHSGMNAYAFIAEKWQRICSGLWPHPGQKRDLEIFFENPQSQQIELRGFRDISPPVPGTKKTAP